MGVLNGAMHQPTIAEYYFKKSLNGNPVNPLSYFYYARWLKNQNRKDEAIPLLKKCLELSPAHARSKDLLNELTAPQKGATQDPLEEAKVPSPISPSPEYFLSLSLRYHNEGRFMDSIKACENALRMKPDYAPAYNNVCAAYNELKMWDKAIKACEKGLAINPDFELMQNNLKLAKNRKAIEEKGGSAEKR